MDTGIEPTASNLRAEGEVHYTIGASGASEKRKFKRVEKGKRTEGRLSETRNGVRRRSTINWEKKP